MNDRLCFTRVALTLCSVLSVGLILFGLYYGLWDSPSEMYQKQTVRIMYVHVPSAWMALLIYTCMALFSVAFLVGKKPLYGFLTRASAPIGAVFAFLCLVSGAFWGKPTWGSWWAWDGRLTSMLILFFLYIGYIALANAFDSPTRGTKAAAILSIAGLLNIPVIIFSVELWSSVHQSSSILKMGGPSIAPSMLLPLLLMSAGFMFYYIALLILRTRSEIADAGIRAMRLQLVQE